MNHVKCCQKPRSCLKALMRGFSPSVPITRTVSKAGCCPIFVDAKDKYVGKFSCNESMQDHQVQVGSFIICLKKQVVKCDKSHIKRIKTESRVHH